MEDLQFGKEVSGNLHLHPQVCKADFLFNFHTRGERVTVIYSSKVFAVGQGSSDLQTQHSSSAPIMVGGGVRGDRKTGDVRLTT